MPRLSRSTSVLFAAILVSLFLFAHGVHIFDANRVLQYDRNGVQYGSRKTAFTAHAVTLEYASKHSHADIVAAPTVEAAKNVISRIGSFGGSFSRRVIIVRLEEVTDVSALQKIMVSPKSSSMTVAGVIILLPADFASRAADAGQSKLFSTLRALEETFLQFSVDIPVYFAFSDAQVSAIYESLKTSSKMPLTEDYQFSVTDKEATPIKKVNAINFEGFLAGSNARVVSSNAAEAFPTIAIVAHYDTLGAIPALNQGADSNGSGTIALLELARIFSKLYSNARTHGGYNLLFLLTGAGRLSYAGSRYWLSQQQHRVHLDNIEFALCLESLAAEHLYLHVSKKTKDEDILRLYKEFKNTADEMGIPFDIVYKKINKTHSEVAWEHEAFAHKKVEGATLSHFPNATPQLSRSSAADFKINTDILNRNIRFIASVLCKYVYASAAGGIPQNEVIFGTEATSKFVESWAQTLSSSSRATPFINKDTPIVSFLDKTLSNYVADVAVQEFQVKSDFTFYGNQQVKVSVFTVKPLIFDMALAVPITAYVLALYAFLTGSSIVDVVRGLFGKKMKETKKSTGGGASASAASASGAKHKKKQ